jgi:stearoyl-CoA desaturase (delta-9 desaturase)
MKLVANHNQTTFVRANLIQVVAIHIVALGVAPFFFSWKALAFAFGSAMVFGYAMGIFHHMLLTHRSFKCKRWIENTGSLLGTLTWRGPFAGPVRYVAMHKIHHAFSDTELDPHTPTKGFWFALLTWFWNMPLGFTRHEYYDTYAPDLAQDPFHAFCDRHVHLLQLIWGALCFLGGGLWPVVLHGASFSVENATRFMVYGVFVRAFLSLYLINAVDLINHTIGYRSYETKDFSTNSFMMAFIHLGGAISWHNNHHAHQHYFHVQKNWWEFDIHHQFLRGLEKLGLVSEILVLDETRGVSEVVVL